MIPLKDTIRTNKVPIINWLIILTNVFVFLYESSLSQSGLESFIQTYALIPAMFQMNDPSTWTPLLSHMFLHGSWMHLLSNVWILFIFGDNLEAQMGSLRYLFFYLIGGFVAAFIQMIFTNDPTLPTLGASGAIAAVMGAYFLLFPTARVVTFIPVFFLPWIVEIPAIIYLGIWFASQLWSGLTSMVSASASVGGVAWWAHIGGFAFGLLISSSLLRTQQKQNPYLINPYPKT